MSHDELELWNKVTAEIQPLKNRAPTLSVPPTNNQPIEIKGKLQTQAKPRFQPEALAPLPPIHHGSSAGLDKNTARRLRRGQTTIEASLDLHGMTQETAFRALSAFVESSFRSGQRCIRIVTGKGLKGEGVLRAAVPKWLNEMSLRPKILSFTHAQPKDGGEGALYVLLRRRR